MLSYKNKLVLVIFTLVFAALGVMAQDITPPTEKGIEPEDFERVAQSGWQFLKIPASAREAALGGVYTGLGSGNANSTFTNPAEMVNVKNFDLGVNRVNWFADIANLSVAMAKNFNGIGVFGLSLLSVDYGDLRRTEYITIDDPGAPTGQRNAINADMGNFTASDIAVGLSYAKQVTDRLSVGVNARYIYNKIDDLSMSNVSIDLGTYYYTGFKSLRLAMVARNFGPDQKLITYNEEVRREPASIKMPSQFRLGLAMDFFDGDGSPHLLTVALEAVHPNDGPEKVNIGLEYTLMNLLIARGGYRFNYDEEGLTLGLGINVSFGQTSLLFDYAYVDFGNLDYVQMFSFGFTF